MPDFLPRPEAQLLQFTRNFSRHIEADPQVYGIDEADAARLALLQSEYELRYSAAIDPGTRTIPAIRARDEAKSALVKQVRYLATRARTLSGLSDATLVTIGLKRPSKSRRRIPPPGEKPFLRVIDVFGPRVTLQARDGNGSGRRGLPRGVMYLDVMYFIGESPSAHRMDWRFAGGYSRARIVIDLPASLPLGAKVWFTSAWLNPTGKRGPWSDPCATRVLTDEVVTLRGRLNAA